VNDMGILDPLDILQTNQSIAFFRNRLITSADKHFALLFKPFFPQNSLNAVSALLFGKHRYFSLSFYFKIYEKYLSLGGIYLLIPLIK